MKRYSNNSPSSKIVFSGSSTGGAELCTSDQFACGDSGKCIPQRWVCDYHKDCENGEDEFNNCREYSYIVF